MGSIKREQGEVSQEGRGTSVERSKVMIGNHN